MLETLTDLISVTAGQGSIGSGESRDFEKVLVLQHHPDPHLVGTCLYDTMKGDGDVVSGNRGQAEEALKIYAVF